MSLSAYPSATSVVQGDFLALHVSADPGDLIDLTVVRVVASDEQVWSGATRADPQPEPPDGSRVGFGWLAPTAIPVSFDWPSGLYRVDLTSQLAGAFSFHIVVRAAEPGGTSPILVVYPDTTGQAYNTAGGYSLYEFQRQDGVFVEQVSFDRPGGLDYGFEGPFARWFDAEGIATEACTSTDIHKVAGLLDPYQLIISTGHDEYWSREMRDAVEEFVARGGNAAFLSGNVSWWQVRLDDDGRTMVCYKDAAADPMRGVDDSRVTVNWADFPVCRPENTLTGVGWRTGAQNAAAGAYTCRFPTHWVFADTALAEGDSFGDTFIGYETDACLFQEVEGRPQATGRDGTPPSFVILATADFMDQANPAAGFATMGIHRRGGTVFTGAAVYWGLGLAADDPHLTTVTRNIVGRLSAPSTDGWDLVAEANDVVAMAGRGGELYAATGDGLLWRRPALPQNLHWTMFGEATCIALAANGYAKATQRQPMFAVDADDTLWKRELDETATWQSLDIAGGCTSLAVSNDGVLHGVDRGGQLWVRFPSDSPTGWTSRGDQGLPVRCLAAQYRSLLAYTADGELWRRTLLPGGTSTTTGWDPFGSALPDVTAMAITEGSLWVTTGASELWRRDL